MYIDEHKLTYDYAEQINQFLIDSAIAGNLNGVKFSLAEGANADIRLNSDIREEGYKFAMKNAHGFTPLMLACSLYGPDALEISETLINAGADVNIQTPNGNNAIINAVGGSAKYNHYKKDAKPLIDALITAGAKVDDGFSNGATPLFIALNEYDGKISLSAVKALLEHGANPNAVTDDNKYSPDVLSTFTWTAAQQRDSLTEQAVKALVEAGAKINPTEDSVIHVEFHSNVPIGSAATGSTGSLELTEYFLKQGANPNVIDKNGKTLVEEAKTPEIKAVLETALNSQKLA